MYGVREAKAGMRKGWGPGGGAGGILEAKLRVPPPSERELVSAPSQGKGKPKASQGRPGRQEKKQEWLAPIAASGNSCLPVIA